IDHLLMVEVRGPQSFLPPSPALAPRPARHLWSDVLLCRSRRFSPARHVFLRLRAERRVKELQHGSVTPACRGQRPRPQMPFLLRPFSLPRVLSFFPLAPCSFPEVSPSFFPRAAPVNHLLSQPLRQSSLPGLQELSFPVRRPFRQQFL